MANNTYTVKQGDTLESIARAHNTTVLAIKHFNSDKIKDTNYIQAGWVLTLPVPTTSYTVKRGDTLTAIARRHNTTVAILQQLNSDKITNVDYIQAGWVITVPKITTKQTEDNKVDSINSVFGSNPQSDRQGCPSNKKIAIFPVRYAIDEKQAQNTEAKHPIPNDWGATELPNINTRNYCMRQLRDGWVYVWDGKKFDEYRLKGTDFKHTNRLDKTIPFMPIVQIEPSEGSKGTKNYLEYEALEPIYLA